MGLLDRAIRNGISKGIGDAVGKAVEKVVSPKAESFANKTAQQFDRATENTVRQTSQATSGLEGAFANLERATQNYATAMSQNLKICSSCGATTTAEVKFCPSCGAKLPETTVAQSAVCTQCGKQNPIGTRFCIDCGTKLPGAVAEDEACAENDKAVLEKWDALLARYPKWCFGGNEYNIEQYDENIMFALKMPSAFAAENAVNQYRALLEQNGFRQAGEYPSKEHLYKKENGQCYHCDTEHCFDGDSDTPTIYFNVGEPTGGFDYVKPEPKKKNDFFSLFK